MKVSESARENIICAIDFYSLFIGVIASIIAFLYGMSFNDQSGWLVIAIVYALVALLSVCYIGSRICLSVKRFFIYKCTFE